MLDPTAIEAARAAQEAKGTPVAPGSGVGACFQLALLAAGQNNDQEAGDYLREIIASMKKMVPRGEADAGSRPNL